MKLLIRFSLFFINDINWARDIMNALFPNNYFYFESDKNEIPQKLNQMSNGKHFIMSNIFFCL